MLDKLKLIETKLSRLGWRRLALGLSVFALTIWLIATPLVEAKSNDITADSHVVTIYNGDDEKTIITSGATVADALRDAKVAVGENDKVTPDRRSSLKDSSMVINVRRARPVTLVDDDGRRSRVVTAETDPAKIASQAGMTLKSRDTTTTQPISQFIAAGGIGEEIQVTRARTVNARVYGQSVTLRTQKKTVGEMLREAGVTLKTSDTISVPLDTIITDGMSLEIWRNGIQTITQEEEVPFETQTIEDSTKKLGYSEVRTAGVKGKKSVIYQVNMQNGIEVSRSEVSEVVTMAPVAEVIVKGTKVELPPGSHTDWMRLAGISESDFGAANYIISRESGWRYNATNASSGAYGLPQALPGSKMASAGSDWATNPITQLKWFNSYCKQRYGSIQNAYNHWLRYKSY